MAELPVDRMVGSLVTDLPEEDLFAGDAVKLENMVFGKAGYPESRPGWRPLDNNLTDPIKHVYAFDAKIGPVLMVYTDTSQLSDPDRLPSLWAWHKPGSLEGYEISGLDKSAPGLAKVSSVEANDWWVFTYNAPGDNRVLYWDGILTEQETAGDLVGSIQVLPNAPPAAQLFYEGQRLWIVRPDEPSTLYASERDVLTNWTVAANQGVRLPITPGDGGTISGLFSFGGTIFAMKDSRTGGSIHQLNEGLDPSGNITWARRTLSTKVGAAHRNLIIVREDRDVFFGSRRGLHSMAKTDQFGDVQSSRIDGEVASIWRSLSVKQKQIAVMIDDWQNERILLSFDANNDGVNDTTYYIHYSRYGPTRRIQGVEERFPSFSGPADYGFNTATSFTFAGNLSGTIVVGKDF